MMSMMRRTRAGRFAESSRTLRPVAENRDQCHVRRPQPPKNAVKLVLLRQILPQERC